MNSDKHTQEFTRWFKQEHPMLFEDISRGDEEAEGLYDIAKEAYIAGRSKTEQEEG